MPTLRIAAMLSTGMAEPAPPLVDVSRDECSAFAERGDSRVCVLEEDGEYLRVTFRSGLVATLRAPRSDFDDVVVRPTHIRTGERFDVLLEPGAWLGRVEHNAPMVTIAYENGYLRVEGSVPEVSVGKVWAPLPPRLPVGEPVSVAGEILEAPNGSVLVTLKKPDVGHVVAHEGNWFQVELRQGPLYVLGWVRHVADPASPFIDYDSVPTGLFKADDCILYSDPQVVLPAGEELAASPGGPTFARTLEAVTAYHSNHCVDGWLRVAMDLPPWQVTAWVKGMPQCVKPEPPRLPSEPARRKKQSMQPSASPP